MENSLYWLRVGVAVYEQMAIEVQTGMDITGPFQFYLRLKPGRPEMFLTCLWNNSTDFNTI